MSEITINVIKVFTVGTAGFIVAFWLAPLLTHFLYKYKLWRKEVKKETIDKRKLVIFQKFHGNKKNKVPRFGGILIWGTTLFLSVFFLLLSKTNIWILKKLSFLDKAQTLLPLFALVGGALVGLVDDALQVSTKIKYIAGGLRLRYRLILVSLLGLIGGWWFYFKLCRTTIHIPGNGDLLIGFWYIPLFVIVMLATYSGGVIDGLDGLAGGIFAGMFGAFGIIALFLNQINISAFCAVVTGAILAFLWFNIPPARFYMGETGVIGLCCALTVVAFLTDSVLVLPIIGFLLVLESGSVIIQLLAKRFLHRKVFLAAPLHYHFEAKGWPHYKVTMRFWVVGIVMAILGIAIRLLG